VTVRALVEIGVIPMRSARSAPATRRSDVLFRNSVHRASPAKVDEETRPLRASRSLVAFGVAFGRDAFARFPDEVAVFAVVSLVRRARANGLRDSAD